MVIVEAKARAKPAVEALMLGVMTAMNPVMPTTTLDNKLKRAESHLLTVGEDC